MARDAAKRLRELIAAGEEIPYEVLEPGDGSPLVQYSPLTERFIRDHAGALRELDSFGAACAALESADLAAPYLEQFGIAPPPDARSRSEMAGIVFLCRLWLDSTDFSLDHERIGAAVAEIQHNGDADEDEIEVVVPLRGLQLPVTRLDLATATMVRADTVEVPSEARVAEGAGAAAWEPTFLAVCRVDADSHSEDPFDDFGVRAVEAFRTLITTLRLFKPGGVALGPHAWTRAGSTRWRRIATGAARPRPGGYRLAESELGDLVAFSRMLARRPAVVGRDSQDRSGPAGALARSISRFEVGLERSAVLEALYDYLLSLRFLLEGGGPADLGLPMRVAALCAEPERRGDVKSVIDRALAIERELWSGEPAPTGDGMTPAETAAVVEDLLRAILKDTACGHLGSDLRATADEILLADGLAIGEGSADQFGETAEWEFEDALREGDETGELEVAAAAGEFETEIEVEAITEPEHAEELLAPEPGESPSAREVWLDSLDARVEQRELWLDALDDDEDEVVQGPEPRGRITGDRFRQPEEEKVYANAQIYDERPTRRREGLEPGSPVARLLEHRSAEREAIADRVAHLFPQPETTEWNVRELDYDRRRRARV